MKRIPQFIIIIFLASLAKSFLKLGIMFICTSARENVNVQEAFIMAAKATMNRPQMERKPVDQW